MIIERTAAEQRTSCRLNDAATGTLRFDHGASVRLHFVCATVSKDLLLEVLQSCRDNLAEFSSAFLLIDEAMGAVVG